MPLKSNKNAKQVVNISIFCHIDPKRFMVFHISANMLWRLFDWCFYYSTNTLQCKISDPKSLTKFWKVLTQFAYIWIFFIQVQTHIRDSDLSWNAYNYTQNNAAFSNAIRHAWKLLIFTRISRLLIYNLF